MIDDPEFARRMRSLHSDDPEFAEKLRVMRSLMDQRINLNGPQVLQVANMTPPQRTDLLGDLVEQAYDEAMEVQKLWLTEDPEVGEPE